MAEERVLASVKLIDAVEPIENADAIECIIIGGWKVIAEKGVYKPGMLAVYIEIDSWVPTTVAAFLSKGKTPSMYNGISGERLKTIKLRGHISQGLLLPADSSWTLGQDVTSILGITKWEPQIPPELVGLMKGNFPCFIPKTAQPRLQNLYPKEITLYSTLKWEITEKLDGSSMTVYINSDDIFCVCSRNVELKESMDNVYWKTAINANLEQILRADMSLKLAIQGELIGEGIQKNPYKLSLKKNKYAHEFYVFDIYDIQNGVYYTPEQRHAFVKKHGLNHVPIILYDSDLQTTQSSNTNTNTNTKEIIDYLLQEAESKSKLCNETEREGLVYKCMNSSKYSFKVISNKFLLKHQ